MAESTTTPVGELQEKSFVHYAPVFVACCLIAAIPSSMLTGAAGIFYPVIAEDFGVPTVEVSLWRTLMYVSCCIFAPFLGKWMTTCDMKKMLLICAIVESLVFALFAIAPAPWVMWIGGLIAGATNIALLGMSISALINRWFRVGVGLLIGVATAMTGLGGIVFISLGQWLIDAYSWRAGYLSYAVISLVTMIPTILFLLRSKPESYGLLPYGTKKAAEKSSQTAERVEKPLCVKPAVAMRSYIFWVVAIFGFVVHMICQMNGYFPKYVIWFNQQPDVVSGMVATAFISSAAIASYNSAGNAAGKIVLGFFSDFSVAVALGALVACGALGCLFMWLFPTTILLPIGSFLFGCFIPGVLVLMPMYVRRMYGNGSKYPIFWGRTQVFITLGGAAGNIIWPIIADSGLGFAGVFTTGLAFLVVCLAMGLFCYTKRDALPRTEE